MKQVYEIFHLMKYHGGWSFIESYNLPIGLRKWYFDLLVKQKESEAEAAKEASKNNK
jgi:hypothetical protein